MGQLLYISVTCQFSDDLAPPRGHWRSIRSEFTVLIPRPCAVDLGTRRLKQL